MLPAAPPFTAPDAGRWLRAGLPRWVTSIALTSLWGLAFLVAAISDTRSCTPQDPSVCGADPNFAVWFVVLMATPVLLLWMPVLGCLAGVCFALADLRYDDVTGARWAFGVHGALCALVAVRLLRGAAEQRRIAAAVARGARVDAGSIAGLPEADGYYLGPRGLLVAGALVLAGTGVLAWYGHQVADERAHLQRAVRAPARIVEVRPDESITIAVRTPAAGTREYRLGVYDSTDPYPLHSSAPVLLDPQDPAWVRLVAEPRDSTLWLSVGAGCYLLALLWLLHRWRLRRGRAALLSGEHPVLRVRVSPDDDGSAIIRPALGGTATQDAERPIASMAVFEIPPESADEDGPTGEGPWDEDGPTGEGPWDEEGWDHETQTAFGRVWRGEEEPGEAEPFRSAADRVEDAVLIGSLADREIVMLMTAEAVLLPSGRLRAGRVGGYPPRHADEPPELGWRRWIGVWRRLTGRDWGGEDELFPGAAVDPAVLRQPPELPLTVRPQARLRATGALMLCAGFAGYPVVLHLVRPDLFQLALSALLCGQLAMGGAARLLSRLRLSHHQFEVVGLWRSHSVPWDRLHGVRRDGAVLSVAWQPDVVTEVGPFDDPDGERGRQDRAEQLGAAMLLHRQRALAGGLPGRESSSRPNATWLVLALYAAEVVATTVLR